MLRVRSGSLFPASFTKLDEQNSRNNNKKSADIAPLIIRSVAKKVIRPDQITIIMTTMHLHHKSSLFLLTAILILVAVTHVHTTPARLTDHLKQITDKILAMNPNVKSPIPSASPVTSSASMAKTLATAIATSSAKQQEIAHALRTGRSRNLNQMSHKRGMFSSFLSLPKGLRAALPLFGIRPFVQSAKPSSSSAGLMPAETMFQPQYLSPQSVTGHPGVPLNQFLESSSIPAGHYARRPAVVPFITPPFLGHVPANGQPADSGDSLGLSESLMSALHHQDHQSHPHHPVRHQIQFIPLPQNHAQQEQSQYEYQPEPQPQQASPQSEDQSGRDQEEAEKVMYVYVDEEGKTIATKVADMGMGPEAALPDGYNIKAVGAPLPVSHQDQQQAHAAQQQQNHDQGREEHDQRAPQQQQQQRPVLAGFADVRDLSAAVSHSPAADPASDSRHPNTNTPIPAPVSDYLDSHNAPQLASSQPNEGHEDMGTEPPVGIGIPVPADDPRAGRIVFPGPDHKPKPLITDDGSVPDSGVDPEVPHSDPTQDMVFMLGDYNQYLKSQSAGEQDGRDAISAADEFLHTLTSSPSASSDMEQHHRPQVQPQEEHRVVSLRPPIRKQRILSTHGGWIPISRSPDHSHDRRENNKPAGIEILAHKETQEVKEAKEQTDDKRQEEKVKEEKPDESDGKNAEEKLAAKSDPSGPKVHFDDETTSNLQDQPNSHSNTRVTFSTSSSISSSRDLERIKSAEKPAVQKRSKYNVAAVFDHEFKPIFTSKAKNLDEVRDHELFSASKGSYGLRIPRSSDFESDASESRIESSLVPSASRGADSSSAASFSLRSGLLSSKLEESLRKPAAHFLVPVPGQDGNVKAYIVLSN